MKLFREGVVQSSRCAADVKGEEGRQREQNVVERKQAQPAKKGVGTMKMKIQMRGRLLPTLR